MRDPSSLAFPEGLARVEARVIQMGFLPLGDLPVGQSPGGSVRGEGRGGAAHDKTNKSGTQVL